MLSWLGRLLGGPPPAVAAADPDSLVRNALEHQAAGRFDQAESLFYRALALVPQSPGIQLHLGALFRAQGRHEAALQSCLEAVRLAPRLAGARNNLGNAYRDLGDLENALAQFREAVALDSRLPEAHFNIAVTVQKQGGADEAIAGYRHALRIKPDFSAAQLNLGFLLEERADVEGAIAAYRGAIAAEPGLVEAHVNLGMQLLLAGRFVEGWDEYEWRLRYPEYSGSDVAAVVPRWDGGEPAGRTVLLDAEQGFGDALQFLRYAPLVAARGARVLVRCGPELAALAAATPGVDGTLQRGATLAGLDLSCPLPSLPRLFGTTLESVPSAVPYVFADAVKRQHWQARFAEAGGDLKVGLVWASQSQHRTAGEKSLPAAALAPLAGVAGVRFYSLQKGSAARQALPAGLRIGHLDAELADFSDTAAAIAALDLVISVDTAVAHLAGAMGKPAWTLLKFAPDWRWLLERGDCPWYPTMRLFRQRRPGDWSVPVAEISEALRGLRRSQAPA
jgi:tetratricopeptide (TPR) repeat protein